MIKHIALAVLVCVFTAQSSFAATPSKKSSAKMEGRQLVMILAPAKAAGIKKN